MTNKIPTKTEVTAAVDRVILLISKEIEENAKKGFHMVGSNPTIETIRAMAELIEARAYMTGEKGKTINEIRKQHGLLPIQGGDFVVPDEYGQVD